MHLKESFFLLEEEQVWKSGMVTFELSPLLLILSLKELNASAASV